MPADSGDKTEAPTPRRLQEAREKGQVAKSQDLSAAVGLLMGLILLNFYGNAILDNWLKLMRQCLTLDMAATDGMMVLDLTWRMAARYVAPILLPLMLLFVVAAILVNVFQVGFMLVTEPLKPSFDKISPISGFKRLFSVRSAVRFAMSLAKVVIISIVAYLTIADYMPELVGMTGLSFVQVIGLGGHLMLILGLRMALVLFILALIDYGFQRYKHTQDLKMTKEEVKEELKRMEGDATMRQRRREVARQLARQRMSQAVPKADVIITNPTHLAIALKYTSEEMPAPKVIARGADYMATRIREIAAEHGIPIIERKPLAQALYKSCEVGDYVPPDLYKAVAEVLAYVYELAGKGYRNSKAV